MIIVILNVDLVPFVLPWIIFVLFLTFCIMRDFVVRFKGWDWYLDGIETAVMVAFDIVLVVVCTSSLKSSSSKMG